jgi:hypothetical protein
MFLQTPIRVIALLAGSAVPLTAQMGWGTEGGRLSPRVEYSMVTARDGGPDDRQWITAVVPLARSA